jgi:hypothetical protein
MSVLVFVEHFDQLAGLIWWNVAPAILKVQDRWFSRSRIYDVRSFPARPGEADRLSRPAGVRKPNPFGVVAYRCRELRAPRHEITILYIVSHPQREQAGRPWVIRHESAAIDLCPAPCGPAGRARAGDPAGLPGNTFELIPRSSRYSTSQSLRFSLRPLPDSRFAIPVSRIQVDSRFPISNSRVLSHCVT